MPESDASMTKALQFDSRSEHIYEVYRRVADIYRRTNIALGRVPQYKITVDSTIKCFNTNERKTSV